MKKRVFLCRIMVLVILGVSACGRTDIESESAQGNRSMEAELSGEGEPAAEGEEGTEGGPEEGAVSTFTDDLGREVSVGAPERVAALLGSYADMWVLAGGSVCAAPDDAFEDFDLPLAEDTVNLGGTKSLSLELLLASEPDFVLASTNTPQHLEWQESLEGAGITVAYFDVACFSDYLRVLNMRMAQSHLSIRTSMLLLALRAKVIRLLLALRAKVMRLLLALRAKVMRL